MNVRRVLQHSSRQFCLRRTYATKENIVSLVGADKQKKGTAPAAATPPSSSCAPDTVLEGINYLKGQSPVLSLPDDQYPDWLWTTLQSKVWPDDGPGGKAERVKRRTENRQRIKDRNFMQTQ